MVFDFMIWRPSSLHSAVAFSSIAHETKILRGKNPTEATISSQKWTNRWCFHSFFADFVGWSLPVLVEKNFGTVPGKEHHVVKFRCFDVTEGPENGQIYGEILGSKIGQICLSFDHFDYQFLWFWLSVTISTIMFPWFWLSATISTISFCNLG